MGNADAWPLVNVFCYRQPAGLERTVTEGILSTKPANSAASFISDHYANQSWQQRRSLVRYERRSRRHHHMKITFGEGLGLQFR